MRKIKFEVVIADGFVFPENDGYTNMHLWELPVGRHESMDIDIEFEPQGGDVMREAEQVLKQHMMKMYPKKDYRIYYWWWE